MYHRLFRRMTLGLVILVAISAAGCQSPHRADQGALFGGLTGAAAGAIIGNQSGNPGAGAAIGAGLGAITGAVVGQEIDEIEAQNRAQIEYQLGRQVAAGAVTINDVVEMSVNGVDDGLIINHVRAHGMAAPLQPSDLSYLTQQQVSNNVIKVMQEPPPQRAQKVVYREAPRPVIVREYHTAPVYVAPPYRPPHYYQRRHRPSQVGWGVSFHN
ncbi:MAG: glycine zipper 2TM domain-containing protein [Candidatus Nealsonbacteria bacterium]|nr:glycine zipper 2TM domain-containing protein [Candidatus Nealsonbacteria bacterium]